jgi:hypothetical protein
VNLAGPLAAALLLAPACRGVPEGTAPGRPRLETEPERFDFGEVLPGRSLTKEFSLRNVGDAPLVIEKLASSCACTVALLDEAKQRLAPGRSTPLRVTLRTPAAPGRVRETVSVTSNDPAQPVVQLEVAAEVKAAR